jgi:hypothetical protein
VSYILLISVDIYEHTIDRIQALGFETECVGGGRILHEPDKKAIKVYGYSQVRMTMICEIAK